MITGSVRVEGLAELEKALIALGDVVGQTVLRQSMLKAVAPMVEAARVNAYSIAKSGSLAVAMGARFRLETTYRGWLRGNVVSAAEVFVGPIRSDRMARAIYSAYYKIGARRGRIVKGIYHGHFVEFGTVHSRARPFLRPAFDSTREIVVQRFAAELRERIAKAAAKQRR